MNILIKLLSFKNVPIKDMDLNKGGNRYSSILEPFLQDVSSSLLQVLGQFASFEPAALLILGKVDWQNWFHRVSNNLCYDIPETNNCNKHLFAATFFQVASPSQPYPE